MSSIIFHSWFVQSTHCITALGSLLWLSERHLKGIRIRRKDGKWPCFPWVMTLPGRGQGTWHSCLMTKNQNRNRPVITHRCEFGIEWPVWKSHANLSKLYELPTKGSVRIITLIRKESMFWNLLNQAYSSFNSIFPLQRKVSSLSCPLSTAFCINVETWWLVLSRKSP